LSRIGDPVIPSVVASGLFVHCSHLNDPAKRALVQKVVTAIKRYVTDRSLSVERQAWLEELLRPEHEKRLKDGIGGFAIEPVSLTEIAKSIVAHDAAIMPESEWPHEAVERAVAWALYPAERKKPVADFFDRSLWDSVR
jgi:hypothetical protein